MTAACLAELKAPPPAPATPPAAPDAAKLVVELAHDLRSPLSAILGLAELLHGQQAGPLNDTQRRYAALIHNAALGLCTMASDMVDLARGPRVAPAERVPFSVCELLDDVNDLCRPVAAEKEIDLRFETAIPRDRWLGHPHALSRVLLNLTTNALKYTDRGRVTVAVRARRPTRLEFSVRDTGRGLDAEVLRSLDEPFREGQDPRRLHSCSAGLGLVICQRLVHALGGALSVETRPGRGTRFWFELEFSPAPKSPAETPPLALDAPTRQARRARDVA